MYELVNYILEDLCALTSTSTNKIYLKTAQNILTVQVYKCIDVQ